MSASYGARVATAEAVHMGGTCVNVGCIPKKLYVYGSHYADDFNDASAYGWSAAPPKMDWPVLKSNKDKEIARLNGIYSGLLDNAGVTHFDGRARLLDAHTIEIGETRVTAEKISWQRGVNRLFRTYRVKRSYQPQMTPLRLSSYRNAFLVLGGGYIAVEFAGIFAGLGVETTLAYRGPKLLRGFDEDLRDMMGRLFVHRGIIPRLNATLAQVSRTDEGALLATFDDGASMEVDFIWRRLEGCPRAQTWGLRRWALIWRDNGAIKVDESFRTSVPNIYALVM